MDELYLKFPSIQEKEEWINYKKEFNSDDRNKRPLSYSETMDYDDWLTKIANNRDGTQLKRGRVPSTAYFLMNGNRILGTLVIRHNIDSDILSKYGGHIGYSIRPSERKKGYATKMLQLGLEKCKELKIKKVMISCKKDNIGSLKTIENNFGKKFEEIYIPEENSIFYKYWIDIE